MWAANESPTNVESIIKIGKQAQPIQAAMGFSGDGTSSDHRVSEIAWIHPRSVIETGTIKDLLMDYVNVANRNAFGFDISYLNDIQFTTYDSSVQGKYDWHVDTFWGNPTTFDRKLSVVIQLSDPESYVGGDFQFDPQYQQPDYNLLRKKGTVLVFPSVLPHRVTPLSSGIRHSLVAWVEGPKFK